MHFVTSRLLKFYPFSATLRAAIRRRAHRGQRAESVAVEEETKQNAQQRIGRVQETHSAVTGVEEFLKRAIFCTTGE